MQLKPVLRWYLEVQKFATDKVFALFRGGSRGGHRGQMTPPSEYTLNYRWWHLIIITEALIIIKRR